MFNKLFKAEGGFTLIELLVTIAILGVLFGIVTLTLSGVGDDALKTVIDAECGVVQSAADIYMAVNPGTLTLDNSGAATAIIASGDVQFAVYLRDLPTSYHYFWDNAGDVTCTDLIP